MRIAVIGSSGTIGSAVVETLKNEHEIIAVGHKSGKYTVDISSQDSIRSLYKSIGKVDAVVSCAGQAGGKPPARCPRARRRCLSWKTARCSPLES